tara:strand:- start:104 stop:277 length:174 start_codon:yes stop_codon:yes gene_type:complete
MSLKTGVPELVIAANTYTDMKYIQENSLHYRADGSKEILGKVKKIRSDESFRQIGSS